MSRLSTLDIIAAKGERKLTMLTAYDYPTAKIVDESGMDMILVGDSLAMVVLGHEDTLSVGMPEMIHHTKAVARGAKRCIVVGDLPFMAYQVSVQQAVENAGRLIKEGGAQAVKLEGGAAVVPQVRAITQAGIPVQGHLGLTPQSAGQLGGFKVQGKSAQAGKQLLEDAQALAEAGCFSLVLEAVPAPLAQRVTRAVSIPTIGIGAGAGCDGQVLVLHDLVGLFDRFLPKFVKRYAELSREMSRAIAAFKQEVEVGSFPDSEHSFSMKQEELDALDRLLKSS
ncbi:MAG: 3-methyl-2-oxobutanoate hydroxymethyltransferase [Desulfovermiculus sp.]|nr:3-methyl-2-oxobutanoate hydroxymethyltransferase [Desulfovermiculus sp.]